MSGAGGSADYGGSDLERLAAEPPKTATLDIARGRVHRGEFTRDRARVLHSASFRRLAGKTQVVAPGGDEVPRTRLTHSLEVAQIAREIGAELGCDADLVDLAGLAHDIGHPPFGHNGEQALDAAGAAAGGFEANAQNLRLLTRLEPKIIGADGRRHGLNLTRASLDATIKYPFTRPAGGGKFGVYADERAVFDWIRQGAPDAASRSLEAQVMDWADDVAYSVHDVEDGLASGRIGLARLADPDECAAVAAAAASAAGASESDMAVVLSELISMPFVRSAVAATGTSSADAAFKQMTSELTGRLATGAVAATRIAAGDGPLRRYDADLVVPPRLAAEVALLKAIAVRYVMADPGRRAAQHREQQILTELVGLLVDRAPAGLDPAFAVDFHAACDDAARFRVVLDQVSLLTDAQAIVRHRRLAAT